MASAVRIEVQSDIADRRLEKWTRTANEHLGVPLRAMREMKVYKVAAVNAAPQKMAEVFADPILQTAYFSTGAEVFAEGAPSFVAEISYRPGVTDNPARSAEEALRLTGVTAEVSSGSLYFLFGDLDEAGARKTAEELLANSLIQKIDVWSYADFVQLPRFTHVALPKPVLAHAPTAATISLDLEDTALEKLSRDRTLALTLDEMKFIKSYYLRADIAAARHKAGLPAQPTDVELEIFAQSWSEHCKHKIFAAKIDYKGPEGETLRIDSLYKTFVKRATKDVEKRRGIDWLISVFSDNAGIVRFDDKLDLCIKVETHNSPSALDPYGGALTGILGVNRDILGCGLGARPIANTDVFCFSPPDMPARGDEKFMPQGPKAPRRILEGVHRGVEDGGNKSGIPTVNGAFFFDPDYAGKPLVFVGTVGVLPPVLPNGRASAEKKLAVGDRIFMVGGAIGADGIHGATFSSMELDESAPATAVQIGDPLTQKRVMDFLLEARDQGLYSAITDNGAGGLSSSVGEMAQMSGGATLDLAKCPVKYPGLSPWELMISESQERMTVAVPVHLAESFENLAQRRGVSATNIGAFDDSGFLTVRYGETLVGQLELAFLHEALPQMQLSAEWKGPRPRAEWSPTTKIGNGKRPAPDDIAPALLALLARPNITSKEKWVRAYDHEVQAATHGKPFVGNNGPADAGVIWLQPHGGSAHAGVAVSCGLAPRLSLVDPYLMAQYAVDEAVRNAVVAGGDPDMLCLLDNFCWPDPVTSPKNPEGAYKLGHLVRACQGLYDICLAYGAPLVSGKDSMKNDFRGKDGRGEDINVSCLPTLMVTAMARVAMGSGVSSAFRAAGDHIYLLGSPAVQSLAGSEYAEAFDVTVAGAPSIDLAENISLYRRFYAALQAGLLRSAHDVSEGGLLVAVAESMIGGGFGAEITCLSDPALLFHEGAGRIIVSVAPAQRAAFEKHFAGCCTDIGSVTAAKVLALGDARTPLDDITAAWRKGF